VNPYETRRYLAEYLQFHFGDRREFFPYPFAPPGALDFHRRIIRDCLLPVRFPHPTRGLDLGCAVGRLTRELARVVDEATGVDNSRQFIRAARRMVREKNVRFLVADAEQIVGAPFRARLFGNGRARQGAPPTEFHVVLAVNLICRLRHPRQFLARLPDLVVPGGQLVLATPYSWLEPYTPRRHWIRPAELPDLLAPRFALKRRRDLPFLIREHERKYQLVISDVLTFRRLPDPPRSR
jgi:SAM-dependent methyltransferase